MKKDVGIRYCARCGEAYALLDAKLRKFHKGFSACCNENLLRQKPKNVSPPGGSMVDKALRN